MHSATEHFIQRLQKRFEPLDRAQIERQNREAAASALNNNDQSEEE